MSVEIGEQLAKRAESAAFETVLRMSLGSVVGRLSGILGQRLACYTAGIDSVITLRSWMLCGDVPYISALRMRFALNAALILSYRFTDPRRIVAWFTWLCDDLAAMSPATFLRSSEDEDELEKRGELLIAAARRQFQSDKALVVCNDIV